MNHVSRCVKRFYLAPSSCVSFSYTLLTIKWNQVLQLWVSDCWLFTFFSDLFLEKFNFIFTQYQLSVEMVLASSVCSGDPNRYFTGTEPFQASRRKRNSDRRETIQDWDNLCWIQACCRTVHTHTAARLMSVKKVIIIFCTTWICCDYSRGVETWCHLCFYA